VQILICVPLLQETKHEPYAYHEALNEGVIFLRFIAKIKSREKNS